MLMLMLMFVSATSQRGPAERDDGRGRWERALVRGQRGHDRLGGDLPVWDHAAHLERRALRVRVP